ncbi:succinate dehydrogenase assembly factor 2-A, mitochondrial [Diabrotica virgifera virgifera]|uniref:Succinate dehydrogenase assembly factor 2, mitochondrial n=1 Tax=Diabrotica virgifera virgifera TaxID=50390 RepID=A0A6P7FLP4_DIAVI|nr:succinate dehydrogenase assembly factor 2-A, mitochondrial [Diabrotica virgifera virgifera]
MAYNLIKQIADVKYIKLFSISGARLMSSTTMIDPPDDLFTVPRPASRENEPIEQRRARLLYQSRKRGMLENDLLLSTFVAKHLKAFDKEQLEKYDRLINGPSNDWELYYWATNMKETPEEYNHDVMDLLKVHCQNLHKESRIRQPDL